MKTILFRFLASVLQFTFTISVCTPNDLIPITDCLTPANAGATFSWYDAMSYVTADNVWADNACHANATVSTIPTIFGGYIPELSLNGQPILVGTTDTAITFGDTETLNVANEHTLFNLCRYYKEGGSPAQGRIIQSANINYFSGFWNGRGGVAGHFGWISTDELDNLPDQWVLSTQTHDSYRGNGYDFTKPGLTPPTGTPDVGILSINNGFSIEVSDFACAEVIVFPEVSLDLSERVCIEAYFDGKYLHYPKYGTVCTQCTEEPTADPTEEPTLCLDTETLIQMVFDILTDIPLGTWNISTVIAACHSAFELMREISDQCYTLDVSLQDLSPARRRVLLQLSEGVKLSVEIRVSQEESDSWDTEAHVHTFIQYVHQALQSAVWYTDDSIEYETETDPSVDPVMDPVMDPTDPKKSKTKSTHKNDGKKKRDMDKVTPQNDGKKKRSLLESDHEKTDVMIDSLGNEIAYKEENDE